MEIVRFFLYIRLVALAAFIAVPLFHSACGDDREVIEYGCGAAGNIISIQREVDIGSLTVTALSPQEVRIGFSAILVAAYIGLRNVDIPSDDTHNLLTSEIETTANRAEFTLTLTQGVALGYHTLTFSTSLDQVTANVVAKPTLPDLLMQPLPLVLAIDGASQTLRLGLLHADIDDQTLYVL